MKSLCVHPPQVEEGHLQQEKPQCSQKKKKRERERHIINHWEEGEEVWSGGYHLRVAEKKILYQKLVWILVSPLPLGA